MSDKSILIINMLRLLSISYEEILNSRFLYQGGGEHIVRIRALESAVFGLHISDREIVR